MIQCRAAASSWSQHARIIRDCAWRHPAGLLMGIGEVFPIRTPLCCAHAPCQKGVAVWGKKRKKQNSVRNWTLVIHRINNKPITRSVIGIFLTVPLLPFIFSFWCHVHMPCPSVVYTNAVGNISAKVKVGIAPVEPITYRTSPVVGVCRSYPRNNVWRKVNLDLL